MIEAESGIPFERMEVIENILDRIQLLYGAEIYAGLNRCYVAVLLVKGGEPSGECDIGYEEAKSSIEEIQHR